MAPTQTKWTRQPDPSTAPPPAGTVLHPSAEPPVFAALAAQWRSAGRMVPGQTDPEWSALVTHVPHVTRT
ncbi:hypothetical protein [Streptomyces sp. NPDC021224]|uniref:hypothetical protein n=1 Tax=unclassified Streptomyces TaxID=2593676 RepID=UPI00379DD1A1